MLLNEMYESRADLGPPRPSEWVWTRLAPHGAAAVMAPKSDDEQSILEALTFDLARALSDCNLRISAPSIITGNQTQTTGFR